MTSEYGDHVSLYLVVLCCVFLQCAASIREETNRSFDLKVRYREGIVWPMYY